MSVAFERRSRTCGPRETAEKQVDAWQFRVHGLNCRYQNNKQRRGRRTRKHLITLASLATGLLLVACSKQEPEAVTESGPADAAAPAEQSIRGPDAGEAGGVDPTVADPAHYSAEFENDQVRILRIAYGPGEASGMHYHPDSVAVFLTDHLVGMTMPDGSTTEIPASAGDAMFIPGGEHLPKNIAGSGWELVLIELKQ